MTCSGGGGIFAARGTSPIMIHVWLITTCFVLVNACTSVSFVTAVLGELAVVLRLLNFIHRR